MPMNSKRRMAWCSHCGRDCDTSHDYPTNNTSCVDCGKILFEGIVATNEFIYTNRISHAARHYKGRETIWCPHCVRKVGTANDDTTGTINCVDCGKVLFEDMHTNNSTHIKDTTRGRDKTPKLSQTKKKKSSSRMNHNVLNTRLGDKPIPVKADDEYSETDGHQWKSYDNEQESCSYDYYNYDYDGGDEDNDY